MHLGFEARELAAMSHEPGAPNGRITGVAHDGRQAKTLVIETNLARMPLVAFATAKWLHHQDLKVEFLKGDLTGTDLKLIVLLQSAFDRWGRNNKIRFTLAQAEKQWGIHHETLKASLRRLKGISIETRALRNDPRNEMGLEISAGFGLINSWRVVSRGAIGGVEVEINAVMAALLRRGSLTLLDESTFFALAKVDEIAARLWIFLETQSRSWKYGLFASDPTEAREVAPLADLLGLKNARRGRVVKRIRVAAAVVARNDPRYSLEVVPSPERDMFTLHVNRLKQFRQPVTTNQRIGVLESAEPHPPISGEASANQRIGVHRQVQNWGLTSIPTSISTSVVTVDKPPPPGPRKTNDGATRHPVAIEGVSDSVSRAWADLPRSRPPSDKQCQVLVEKEAQWGSEQLADFLDARGAEGKDTYQTIASIFEFVRSEASAAKSRDRDLAAEAHPKRAGTELEASEQGGTRTAEQVLEETMSARLDAVLASIPASRLDTLRWRVIRLDWAPSKLYVLVSDASSDDTAWETQLAAGMARLLGQPFAVEIREKAKPHTADLPARPSVRLRITNRDQKTTRSRPEVASEVLAALVAATGARRCPRSTEEGLKIAIASRGVARVVEWLRQHVGIAVTEVGPQIVIDLANEAGGAAASEGLMPVATNRSA